MRWEWRPLVEGDAPELVALAQRVAARDGGHPMAVTESYLRSRFLNTTSHATFDGPRLVAAAGTRPLEDGRAAVGLVDPDARTAGIGATLVDWALTEGGATRFETEGLTESADALFRANGLHRTFAEAVMTFDLGQPVPTASTTVRLEEWTDQRASRFFAVYTRAFQDRPGFPGWSERRWVDHITDGDDFAPEWTVIASDDEQDIGFIACDRGAWVVQVGVTPAARGTGLGSALVAGALRRMKTAGERTCYLDVNVNNPTARRLYERLGFETIGRRARYETIG